MWESGEGDCGFADAREDCGFGDSGEDCGFADAGRGNLPCLPGGCSRMLRSPRHSAVMLWPRTVAAPSSPWLTAIS